MLMTKKNSYICPESDLRTIVVGRVVCASDTFESQQNEEVNEEEYLW